MEEQKMVIIINGKGGSGKDTICDVLARHYSIRNTSTITNVKTAARALGWDDAKTYADRKFLSDLKDLWIKYNDGPFNYAFNVYKIFMDTSAVRSRILIIHVREPEEIKKLKTAIEKDGRVPCKTLLITSKRTKNLSYGNHADDMVNYYPYDFIYRNSGPLETIDHDFMNFFYRYMAPSWLESH